MWEITQNYVLNTLFNSTNNAVEEATGTVQDSWTTSKAVCTWFVVDCSAGGIVTGINVTTNNLNATLPTELQGLTAFSKEIICTVYQVMLSSFSNATRPFPQPRLISIITMSSGKFHLPLAHYPPCRRSTSEAISLLARFLMIFINCKAFY